MALEALLGQGQGQVQGQGVSVQAALGWGQLAEERGFQLLGRRGCWNLLLLHDYKKPVPKSGRYAT